MSIKETYNDEIDLAEVFKTISRGKKKLIIILIISIFFAIGFNKNQSTPTVKSTTEIKPLSEGELNVFDLSNSMNIYNINATKLYDNFFDILQKRTAIRNAIKKFKIVSKENYENNEKYEEAVSLASHRIKINFFRSSNTILDKDSSLNNYSTIVLKGADKNKLFELIKYIKNENNRLSINNIEQEFERKIFTLRKLDEIEKKEILVSIQDKKDEYDVQINKALQNLKFEIEDLDIAIKNSFNDYELKTSKRLRYLKEQASIARKLEIPKLKDGTPLQSYSLLGGNDSGPFYLMGYEAIDKEIEIIKDRQDIKLYALNERLIRQKRKLEQNKIVERKDLNKLYLGGILVLEKRLKDKDRNELLFSRAENLFKENMAEFTNKLDSVIFDPYSTKFESQPNISFSKILIIAILLGLILSVFYIMIEEKIKKVTSY